MCTLMKKNLPKKTKTKLQKAVRRPTSKLKRRATRKRRKAGTARVAAKPVTPVRKSRAAKQPKAAVKSAAKWKPVAASAAPKQVFIEENLGDLPEAYGTGRLFLVARDPHWLFAYWDLSWQQMADARKLAVDERLVLRVLEKNHTRPIQELTLHHDSHNWYIHVGKPATTYSAQLGYWQRDSGFHVISQSRETTTPSESVSPDMAARFVKIPLEMPFGELVDMIRGHQHYGERLADALHRLELAHFPFPFEVDAVLGPWTAEQATALERLLGGDLLQRVQAGSFEISEWLRQQLQEQLGSATFSESSPAGDDCRMLESQSERGTTGDGDTGGLEPLMSLEPSEVV